MTAGAGRSTRRMSRRRIGSVGMPASSRPPRSTAPSTAHPRWKRYAVGATGRRANSCSPGRRPKFITHWKRLTEKCENSIALMETRLKALSPKVGAVLFQLPPQFSKNHERLALFLNMLPRRYRYAFEFRHKSWYEDDIIDLLRDHDVALCLSDHHDAPAPWQETARHVYVRGHGPGGCYKDHYAAKTLRRWARDIARWKRQRRTVFIYFDNDQKSAAPLDARRLIEMLR